MSDIDDEFSRLIGAVIRKYYCSIHGRQPFYLPLGDQEGEVNTYCKRCIDEFLRKHIRPMEVRDECGDDN